MLETLFQFMDLIGSLAIVVIVGVLLATRRLDRYGLALFIVGMLLGSVWEFGFHFNGPLYRPDDPLYVHVSTWPLAPILQPALHCLWDGAIFLIGVGLVRRLLPPPYFARFRWGELLVLLIWGVGSALVVEIVGSASWYYVPRPWNPTLFEVNGMPITLLPVGTWFVAVLAFYPIALWLRPRVKAQRVAADRGRSHGARRA
jgi:hypothetical protein